MTDPLRLRPAAPGDEALLLGYVRGIATAEAMEHAVTSRPEQFTRALFGPTPSARALVVEYAGQPIGYALWFTNFSTFTGNPGLYIEDVFIDAGYRGRGIGRAVFRHLARLAVADGCDRVQWWVKNTNDAAAGFYRRLNAEPMSGYTVQRLSGASLAALAT